MQPKNHIVDRDGVGDVLCDGRVRVISHDDGGSRRSPAGIMPPLGDASLLAKRRARLVHLVALGGALGGGMGISASGAEHVGRSLSRSRLEIVQS